MRTIAFQSTRSLRSATVFDNGDTDPLKISIHALLAERDSGQHTDFVLQQDFNPRAPCGARRRKRKLSGNRPLFQSTRSLRSATHWMPLPEPPKGISIHALLAERDFIDDLSISSVLLFQSTRSLRSATCTAVLVDFISQFQSTRSLRSATVTAQNYKVLAAISIHALLAERDTTLAEGRQHFAISIHALLAERDRSQIAFTAAITDFNPRAPCGARR